MIDVERFEIVQRAARRRFKNDDDAVQNVLCYWWSEFGRQCEKHDVDSASKIAYRKAVSKVHNGRRFGSPKPRSGRRKLDVVSWFNAYGELQDTTVPNYVDACDSQHLKALADQADCGIAVTYAVGRRSVGGWSRRAVETFDLKNPHDEPATAPVMDDSIVALLKSSETTGDDGTRLRIGSDVEPVARPKPATVNPRFVFDSPNGPWCRTEPTTTTATTTTTTTTDDRPAFGAGRVVNSWRDLPRLATVLRSVVDEL